MSRKLLLPFIAAVLSVAAAVHSLRIAPALASDAGPISNTTTASTAINVPGFATSGNGTLASPWTGWRARITWESGKRYYFPAGHYNLDAPIALLDLLSVSLIGDAEATYLHWTGSAGGTMIRVEESTGTIGTKHHTIDGFILDGNKTALLGIYGLSFHHGQIRNIRAYHITGTNSAIVKLEGTDQADVTNVYSRSEDYDSNTAWPDYGIWLLGRTGVGQCDCVRMSGNRIRGTKKHALYMDNCIYCTETGGAYEYAGLSGASYYGVYVTSTSTHNTFNSTALEACYNGSYYVAGSFNTFNSTTGINAQSTVAGTSNTFNQAFFESVTFSDGADYNYMIGGGAVGYAITNHANNVNNVIWPNNDDGARHYTPARIIRKQRVLNISGSSSAVRPGDIVSYFGGGGHTLTATYADYDWTGKSFDVNNYTGSTLTIAVSAGNIKVSGIGTESSTKTLAANTSCTVTFDGSYWVMKVY